MRAGATACALVAVAILLVLSPSSFGHTPSATAMIPPNPPGSPGRGVAETSSGIPPLVSDDLIGVVTTDVNGYGVPPVLVGATVTAYSVPCEGPIPTLANCVPVNQTVTNTTGGFALNVPTGSYDVAVAPDGAITGGAYPNGFGGSVVSVTAPNSSIALTVYPFVPYGNATIELPGYTCLSAYLNDEPPQSGPGCQNPVLSWTQDGAFYINSTDEIVFYSFVNRTVYGIAPWTPLYQKFPSYAMIPNELGITQDGSYLYSWGTLSTSSTTVTAVAINVTTHRVFEYNFTSFGTAAVKENGQIQLTGWDGNDSQLTVILANGSVVDHGLWGASEKFVAKFDFFEANNAYWLPDLNGYVNVEAGGSSADEVEEWQLEGPSSPELTRTYLEPWNPGGGIEVEGVNGVSFNASSREVDVQAEWSGLVYSVSGSGTLTALLEETNRYPAHKTPPREPVGNAAPSDRPTIPVNGPDYSGNYQGFGNNSWLVSMVPGHLGFESTNVSPYLYNGALPFNYAWYQWTQEGAFYNTSYLIAPTSYSCEENNSLCPINGSSGYPSGTIWWMWRLGLPEFPNPSTAPIADIGPPPPTVITGARPNLTSIDLTWVAPEEGNLINYTVGWGTSSALDNYTSVPPDQHQYTISGLEPGTAYNVSVVAWNLHFHGTSAGISSVTTLRWSTNLTATASTSSTISLSWTTPVEPFTNLSLDYGNSSSNLTTHLSVGTVSSYTVSGLQPQTTYYFQIVPWNGSEPDLPSNIVEWSTAAPSEVTNFEVTSVTPVSVSLAWTDPTEPFTVLNLTYGTSPSNLNESLLLGIVTNATVTGLAPGTAYWFEIVPWNFSTEGTPSPEIEATTPGLPVVTSVTVTGATLQSISLSWTEPTAPATNLTLEYGASSANLSTHLSLGLESSTTVGGLVPATTYWFALVAWNGAIPGPPSVEVEGTTVSLPAISSLNVTGVNETWIALEWTNPTAPFTNLTVEYGNSSTDLSIHLSLGVIAPEYTVLGLHPASTYWFEVVPWNANFAGFGSPKVEGTTVGLPVVSGFQVTTATVSSITLAWTNPTTPFTNLSVEFGISPTGLVHSESVGRVTGYVVTDLAPGTDYWFSVVAYDGSLSGPASAEIEGATLTPPPLLLSVTGVTQGTVTLAWTGTPGNASSLQIRMGPAPGNLTSVAWLTPETVIFTETGLAPATTYWFEVVAYANSTSVGSPGPGPISYPTYSNVIRAATTAAPNMILLVVSDPVVWGAGLLVAGAIGLIAGRWRPRTRGPAQG